mgnify:CR=1 FL=1
MYPKNTGMILVPSRAHNKAFAAERKKPRPLKSDVMPFMGNKQKGEKKTMKKISIIMAIILIACVAWADDELALVETVAGPDSRVGGLAWASGYLWVSYEDNSSIYNGKILKIDMSGNVVTSFNAPGDIGLYDVPDTAGLTFDGTYLWNINLKDDVIYKLTTGGETISSIPTPGKYCYSLAWDGEYLWVNNTDSDKIYKIRPSDGEILHTVNAPGWEKNINADGLAHDGKYLWVSNNYGKKIFRVNPQTGEIVSEYINTFSLGFAESLTWDGQYIWAGGSSSAIKKYMIAQLPEGYPNPTMEQVDLLPDNFDGLVLYFDKVNFFPNIREITSFDQTIYGVSVNSKDGKYYSGSLDENEINFYVTENFATDIIYANLGDDIQNANLFCAVETKTTSDGEKTYWMCKIIKIEIRGDEGSISQVLEETGSLPPNPLEEAIAEERSKWDAVGDGKIGLPEAIRALQITAGIR